MRTQWLEGEKHRALSLLDFYSVKSFKPKNEHYPLSPSVCVCVVAALCLLHFASLHLRNHRYAAASGAQSSRRKWANTKPLEWPEEDKEQIWLSSFSGHKCTWWKIYILAAIMYVCGIIALQQPPRGISRELNGTAWLSHACISA